MITRELRKEYDFQRKHGGGWVGHDAECALRSAKAYLVLQEAIDAGIAEVRWEFDEYPDTSWMDERELEDLRNERTFLLEFVLLINGEVAQALGGVHVGSRCTGDPYCKVIEAEMASEVLTDLQDALRGIEDTADVGY